MAKLPGQYIRIRFMAGMWVEKTLRQHLSKIFVIIMRYSYLNPKGFK